MSAVNFLARSSIGPFPAAAGDQQLPWLPAEEGPDLLDRLIQQEKEERIAAAAFPLAMQIVELRGRHESRGWGGPPSCPKPGFDLRSSNYMSRPKEVTWGRPITGAGSKPLQWPHIYGHQHSQHQVVQSLASGESHPGFPPVSLKLPPPSHPPAVQMHSHTMGVKAANLSSYSPLPTSFPPPPGSPASLHLRLEEAHLQLRAMEKERKRAEAALARHHPGLSRLPGSTAFPSVGSGAPRLPPHPSRLDKLVVDSWREHSRVLALLERMTKVQGAPQHPGISASFQGWQEAVMALAELRRGLLGEVKADARIANYSKAVRRARTSLWAALQAATITPLSTQEQQ